MNAYRKLRFNNSKLRGKRKYRADLYNRLIVGLLFLSIIGAAAGGSRLLSKVGKSTSANEAVSSNESTGVTSDQSREEEQSASAATIDDATDPSGQDRQTVSEDSEENIENTDLAAAGEANANSSEGNTDDTQVSILVLNGSGVTGLAGKVADKLQTIGFEQVETGNASAWDYIDSEIFYPADLAVQAKALITRFNNPDTLVENQEQFPGNSEDIVVILGENFVLDELN